LAAFFGRRRGGMLGRMNFYIETSIQPGLTIDEYRRSRPRPLGRWERLKRLLGGAQAATA
jgi:hypothetical protein